MSRRAAILNWSLAIAGSFLALPAVARADEFVGEVTGTSDNVHVRSGPSTNFYPVVRLSPGDRVKVVGEESGWYAIQPLPGCFSLVSKHYVDIGANGEGVVNGSAVRVRAGSDLDEHRYAVQAKLDKGAVVKVLGEEAEGFLKIVPPAGVRLWIHSDYVARVPDDRLASEQKPGAGPSSVQPAPANPAPAPVSAPAGTVAVSEDVADTAEEVADEIVAPDFAAGTEAAEPAVQEPGIVPAAAPAPVADADADVAALTPETLSKAISGKDEVKPVAPASQAGTLTKSMASRDAKAVGGLKVEDGGVENPVLREQLTNMDEQFVAEMAKPVDERNLDAIVAGFGELAKQGEDKFVQLYAERRLAQVELAVATTEAIRDIRTLSDDVARDRREALEGRSKLRPLPVRMVMRGFDAKGELRESMIFSSNAGPKRYRLVDPEATLPRTLCYVEIADDLKIDVKQFMGRTVGIRARKQYLETDNVDPIPVVVAEEIVILDGPEAAPPTQTSAAPADSTVLVADVDTRD